MAQTDRKTRATDPAGDKSVREAQGGVTKLQGQNWLLVSASAEEEKRASAGNQGIQIPTFFALLASVFAIVGAVALFINPRFDDVNQNINRLESRISEFEAGLTKLEDEVTKLDGKLSAIGHMFVIAFQDGQLDAEEITSIWQQASQ